MTGEGFQWKAARDGQVPEGAVQVDSNKKRTNKQNALGEERKVKVIMILVTKDGQVPEVDSNNNRQTNCQGGYEADP